MRGTPIEPECGPAAVVSTPETISAAHAAPTSSASWRTRSGTGSPRIPHASIATMTPRASTTIESRKWVPTSHGFSL